jgi:hypothetical protein
MDVRLTQALDLSKFRYTLFLEKRRLQEKLRADLTFSVNGGQFYIDRNFIVFLNLLVPEEGTMSATILDDNLTPIYIDDLAKLQKTVLDIYTRTVNQYQLDFDALRKKRKPAAIVDL